MKISARSRYGLMAAVEFARLTNHTHTPLKFVAEKHGISEGYLEQIFSALKKAGIVKSLKGSQGGYTLTKPASEITVEAIFIALEGTLEIVERKNDLDGDTALLESCFNDLLWNPLDHTIFQLIQNVTLEDLVHEYESRQGTQAVMYYI
jgi:Rrf2 family transcriptional regulator, cysteine metabolism repressor